MVSYSQNLRLTLQDIGENDGTWGTVANVGVFELLEDAVAGLENIAMVNGTNALSTLQGAADQSRAAMLNLTGTLSTASTVDIPGVSKLYVVINATGGAQDIDIQVSGGGGASVRLPAATSRIWVMCDGTNCYEIETGTAINATTADTATDSTQLGGVAAASYARLDIAQGFTRAQDSGRSTLSESANNVAVNASLSNAFFLLMEGNWNLSNPTNPRDGQTIRILIKQDAGGSRTISWGSQYRFPGGLTPTLSTAANAVDLAGFEYYQADNIWVGNLIKNLS